MLNMEPDDAHGMLLSGPAIAKIQKACIKKAFQEACGDNNLLLMLVVLLRELLHFL